MDGDHYFSAQPATPDQRRTLTVRIAGRERDVETARGVFSPDRIDLGTSVLLREAPDPPDGGHLLDLGCGWGPLALTMATVAPSSTVWAVDVNERALDLVRRNAASLGLERVRAVPPDEMPDDVAFTAIWSNPPIRVGKDELHGMLRRWLPRLESGGEAYLVVQRNLGGDSLHRWLTAELPDLRTTRHGSAKGFRVLRVRRGVTPGR